ncbi:Uncharacterised protein [Cedecea neteri]|uniref:Uncharacterized protein n=1 Tax=Cedecea neteri TaxID=158822 RepID=A0A2X2T7A0_9ENTR|nr:Uncharacterised protein [Cedecea neteri]
MSSLRAFFDELALPASLVRSVAARRGRGMSPAEGPVQKITLVNIPFRPAGVPGRKPGTMAMVFMLT